MAEYTITLSEADFAKVSWLARKRGVTATTVLSQALSTEALIDANRKPGDDILVGKDPHFKKLILNR